MKFPLIQDLNIVNKRIFLRLDLNIPFDDDNQKILDDFRIQKSIKTIEYILNHNPKQLILATHFSHKKERLFNPIKLIKIYLERFLQKKIYFAEGKINKDLLMSLPDDQIILLDDLRLSESEIENDKEFAKILICKSDIYINEAFSVCHRSHASIIWPPQMIPYAIGFQFQNEIRKLSYFQNNFNNGILLIGGAKIKSKIKLISALGSQAKYILIGGGIANTCLAAKNYSIGNSFFLESEINLAKEFLLSFHNKIIFPKDYLIKNNHEYYFSSLKNLNPNESIVDIGEQTINHFSSYIKNSSSLFWAGPMGYIENSNSAKGSLSIANIIGSSSNLSYAGGGETAYAIKLAKQEQAFDFISTGGGAALAFLAKEEMPGLNVL